MYDECPQSPTPRYATCESPGASQRHRQTQPSAGAEQGRFPNPGKILQGTAPKSYLDILGCSHTRQSPAKFAACVILDRDMSNDEQVLLAGLLVPEVTLWSPNNRYVTDEALLVSFSRYDMTCAAWPWYLPSKQAFSFWSVSVHLKDPRERCRSCELIMLTPS
jgi:hypothetical protein